MKDIFSTNLCWRNCKKYPPKRLGVDIMLTNGVAIYEGFCKMSLDGAARWYVNSEHEATYEVISSENLEFWWWTDIIEQVREEFGED